jgi:uncharacterized membrane protein YgaE (UPF0421/DUF939 family)
MWAVVATIFVLRGSYEESAKAALLRTSATVLSFALCLVYLLVFPFRVWGMVVLIAIGAIVLDLIGRSEDIITASIYHHGRDGCCGHQPPACMDATNPAVN